MNARTLKRRADGQMAARKAARLRANDRAMRKLFKVTRGALRDFLRRSDEILIPVLTPGQVKAWRPVSYVSRVLGFKKGAS